MKSWIAVLIAVVCVSWASQASAQIFFNPAARAAARAARAQVRAAQQTAALQASAFGARAIVPHVNAQVFVAPQTIPIQGYPVPTNAVVVPQAFVAPQAFGIQSLVPYGGGFQQFSFGVSGCCR